MDTERNIQQLQTELDSTLTLSQRSQLQALELLRTQPPATEPAVAVEHVPAAVTAADGAGNGNGEAGGNGNGNGATGDKAGNKVYSQPVSAPESGVRDSAGRFLPGGPSANPAGRPPKRQEQAYMQAAYAAVSPDEFKEATRRIFNHIIETGSIRAYAVLADRLSGQPSQHVRHEDVVTPGDWLQALLDDVGVGESSDTQHDA